MRVKFTILTIVFATICVCLSVNLALVLLNMKSDVAFYMGCLTLAAGLLGYPSLFVYIIQKGFNKK